jgi:heme/copper-type cytochrome/quinol oxidase subunit 4
MVNRSHADPKGENSRKPLKWMLVDSVIIGLIALATVMPERVPTAADLWLMFKAFLYSFMFQLAVERGLKRPREEGNT